MNEAVSVVLLLHVAKCC